MACGGRPAAWACAQGTTACPGCRRCGWSEGQGYAPAVGGGHGLVIEPSPALGEVAEMQGAADRDRHRDTAGPVGAATKRVGEGVPVVEATDDRYGALGLIGGKREGGAGGGNPRRAGGLFP